MLLELPPHAFSYAYYFVLIFLRRNENKAEYKLSQMHGVGATQFGALRPPIGLKGAPNQFHSHSYQLNVDFMFYLLQSSCIVLGPGGFYLFIFDMPNGTCSNVFTADWYLLHIYCSFLSSLKYSSEVDFLAESLTVFSGLVFFRNGIRRELVKDMGCQLRR